MLLHRPNMKIIINKFNRYREKNSNKFYSQKYPKIKQGGKRKFIIKSIVGWLFVFGILKSAIELYKDYSLNLSLMPIGAIENTFSINLFLGFFAGLITGNIQWAIWRDGYRNHKTNLVEENKT